MTGTDTALCRECENYVPRQKADPTTYNPGDGTVLCPECDPSTFVV